MARELTAEEVATIVDLAEQGWSRNAIARQVGRSGAVVSRVAADAGITFDRQRTAQATRARQVDAEAVRADLGLELLGQAEETLATLSQTSEPHERLAVAKAVSSLVAAHTRLVAVDGGQRGDGGDGGDVDAWLEHVAGAGLASALDIEERNG